MTHSDYESAINAGASDAHFPAIIVDWMIDVNGYKYELEGPNGEILVYDPYAEDNIDLLSQGFRYSPEAMRAILLGMIFGMYHPEVGQLNSPTIQFAMNANFYGYFTDLLTKEEYNYFVSGTKEGTRMRGNFAQTEKELWAGNAETNRIGAQVFAEITQAVLCCESEHAGKVKILVYGTWNGVPHPGHYFAVRDSISTVHHNYGVPLEDIVVMVVGEPNRNIRYLDKKPFADSTTRLSFLSYLPEIDIVALAPKLPSDSAMYYWMEGDDNAATKRWRYLTKLIKPDFMPVDMLDEANREHRIEVAKGCGATPIELHRAGLRHTMKYPFIDEVDFSRSISSTNMLDPELSMRDYRNDVWTHLFARAAAIKTGHRMQGLSRKYFN